MDSSRRSADGLPVRVDAPPPPSCPPIPGLTRAYLDLGCGTGQVAIPLARHVEEVVGLDPEPEMLAEARVQAQRAGVPAIVWMEAGSEDVERLPSRPGTFRLVTIGNAFHRMDRERTLAVLADVLVCGGGLVVAADGQGVGTPPPYLRAVHAVLERYLGDTWRARHTRSASATHPVDSHEAVIRRSPFTRIETYRHECHSVWDLEHLIGYLSSTSFASPAVLGDQRGHRAGAAPDAGGPQSRRQFAADVAIEAILAWRA